MLVWWCDIQMVTKDFSEMKPWWSGVLRPCRVELLARHSSEEGLTWVKLANILRVFVWVLETWCQHCCPGSTVGILFLTKLARRWGRRVPRLEQRNIFGVSDTLLALHVSIIFKNFSVKIKLSQTFQCTLLHCLLPSLSLKTTTLH